MKRRALLTEQKITGQLPLKCCFRSHLEAKMKDRVKGVLLWRMLDKKMRHV